MKRNGSYLRQYLPWLGLLLGVDALSVAGVSPALLPRADAGRSGARRLDLFAPDAIYLNPAARLALGEPDALEIRTGQRWITLRVAGSVGAPGAPLAVMDVAAAQDLLNQGGQLSRIDLRLAPGTNADALLAALALPASVFAQRPEQAGERVSNLESPLLSLTSKLLKRSRTSIRDERRSPRDQSVSRD